MIKIRILLAVLCSGFSTFSVGAVESSTLTNQMANNVSIIEKIENLKQILQNNVEIVVDPNADDLNWMAKDMMIYLRSDLEDLLDSCKNLSIILPDVMKYPQEIPTTSDLLIKIYKEMEEKNLSASLGRNDNFTDAIDFRRKMEQVGVVKCERGVGKFFFDAYGSMYNKILGRVNSIFENLKKHVKDFTGVHINDLDGNYASMNVPQNEEVDYAKYQKLMNVISETVDQAGLYIKNPKRLVEDL